MKRSPATGREAAVSPPSEMPLLVSRIQRGSFLDGPGIRTVVFFKGCPLRCRWCCNAESLRSQVEIRFCPGFCPGPDICGLCVPACPRGAILPAAASIPPSLVLHRQACTACGKCAAVCPSGALEIMGRRLGAEDIVAEVEKDRDFFQASGGGLTLSGGEPMASPALPAQTLRLAKSRGIHTAVETCGWFDMDSADARAALAHTDLIIFDIKHWDSMEHRKATQVENGRILENLRRLGFEYRHIPILARTVVVPGFNDTRQHINAIARMAAKIPSVYAHELIPYSPAGENKPQELGHPQAAARMELLDAKLLAVLRDTVRDCRS